MKRTTLSKKLKVVLSEKKLNKPGKNIVFWSNGTGHFNKR